MSENQNKRKSFKERALTWLGTRGFFRWMDDRTYISMIYKSAFGKKPDLDHPKTFNEAIQWLKLNDRNPLYPTLVDKYEVKSYIADTIGAEYVVPNYGVWDSFDEIDFDALPDQFVLKCTHDSGGVVICPDKAKLDRKAARKKITKCLKRNFYWFGREWPYRDLKPRIIAEKYLWDSVTQDLRDYKFFCFGGEVKFFMIIFGRDAGIRANFYDRDGRMMTAEQETLTPAYDENIRVPPTVGRMTELAEQLSAGRIFQRVDFYDVDGKIYLGEITLHSTSGFLKYYPEEWDYTFGSYIKIDDGAA